MESRIAPATATLSSGVLTIDYTATGATVENAVALNDGTSILLSGNIAGAVNSPSGSVTKIVVTDSGGGTAQSLTMEGSFLLSGGLTAAGVESVVLHAVLTATGAGAVNITGQTITTTEPVTTSGATINLQATGDITLRAAVVSSGGAMTFKADSDGDGAGTFTIAPPFSEFVDPNPAPGNGFGTAIVPLTTGNVVITSPGDDFGGTDAGAVYLFNGYTGALISTLRGSSSNDGVGSDGVVALTNGNYVVRSGFWNNGAATFAGAVTWASGITGVNGVVSAANSLVGSTFQDVVGYFGVTALPNGHYVVSSPIWDNGATSDVGAVTWCNGATGVTGVASAANSLVGSSVDDSVGEVTVLTNGNYVVSSIGWDNGANPDAGAVTWGNGATGITGVVSAGNSLVGSTGDFVGYSGVTVLTNGNYVVSSRYWNGGVGAVTWGNGATGSTGVVLAANSLVGSTLDDLVDFEVTELTNGNYVVRSPFWDNGVATNAGAVTWGNGATGITGVVSSANSLVGSTIFDQVGAYEITVLPNGNYVVLSPVWDNGAATNAGAVTWGNGATGITGVVSAANSLVGSTADDGVGGDEVTALTNGNYVVTSPLWNNGAATTAGAVTWGNGATGITGVVSATNSLVGSTAGDLVGYDGVTVLPNGNYVVRSPFWDNGVATNAGAVTWGNGATGITGVVSATNSLVGSTANDLFPSDVTVLANGNYVVISPDWNNGFNADAGAVTWGNGATGVTGVVSAANSLVGSTVDDSVGTFGITVLTNGNYVVHSPSWNNGAAINAGAVTWVNGATGITGAVSAANSLVGSAGGDNVGGSPGVCVLPNGNYVVGSPNWNNGATSDAGAVTWGNGATGITGVVSAANSLVGSTANDGVGYEVTALTNGNYVVSSPEWNNGAATFAGAVTWGNGATGTTGVVSAANSLVGSTGDDFVGYSGVMALTNGNYVVRSHFWNNGAVTAAGAVTWGNGATGSTGVVSAANSLVGSTVNDLIDSEVTALTNGNYVVISPDWDNGAKSDAGAVTWGNGTTGTSGPITSTNSAVGSVANAGLKNSIFIDTVNDTFYARFTNDGGGRVRLGSQGSGFAITSGLSAGVGSITSAAADVTISAPINSSSSVTFTTTQANRPIDLGNNTIGALGLTDSELDNVVTGTLRVGDVNSGALTVSAGISRTANTAMELNSGAAIAFNAGLNSAGGNIALTAGDAITQSAGILETTGTLRPNHGAGKSATFNSAGNKVANLVIPVGMTGLVNGSFDSPNFVQVDGTLGGNIGSVGTTTVSGTGKIAPGTSPGKLTTGNVAFNTNSVFEAELNGTIDAEYDRQVVIGSVNLGGAELKGLLGPSFVPPPDSVYKIIDNDNITDAVTGTFDGYIEDATVPIGGYNFRISYKGGDGNDVTLTQIPAPTASVTFGDGSNQRSMVTQMVVNFANGPVTFTGDVTAAITLSRNQAGSTQPGGNGPVALTANPASGIMSAVTITFGGALTSSGSLIDGFYDLKIDANQVSGAGGKLDGGAGAGTDYTVTGNTTNKYFRLFGDADGTGVTDLNDFSSFRNVYNLSSTVFDYSNSDDLADFNDFIEFRNRYNLMP